MIRKIINILVTISSFVFCYKMTKKMYVFDMLFYSLYMKRCLASLEDVFILGRGLTIENTFSTKY